MARCLWRIFKSEAQLACLLVFFFGLCQIGFWRASASIKRLVEQPERRLVQSTNGTGVAKLHFRHEPRIP